MEWMYGGGDWAMGLMWLVWLAIIATVIVIAVRLARGSAAGRVSRESAQDILDKRFANGEIGREEYEASSKLLRHSVGYRPGHRSI
jgi:putative membrane protein